MLLAVPIERSDGLQHLITKVSSVLICINVKEPPSRYLLTTPPPLKRKTLEKSRFGKSLCWDASSLGNLWLAGSSSNLLSQLFDRVCIKEHFENSWWNQFSDKILNSISWTLEVVSKVCWIWNRYTFLNFHTWTKTWKKCYSISILIHRSNNYLMIFESVYFQINGATLID